MASIMTPSSQGFQHHPSYLVATGPWIQASWSSFQSGCHPLPTMIGFDATHRLPAQTELVRVGLESSGTFCCAESEPDLQRHGEMFLSQPGWTFVIASLDQVHDEDQGLLMSLLNYLRRQGHQLTLVLSFDETKGSRQDCHQRIAPLKAIVDLVLPLGISQHASSVDSAKLAIPPKQLDGVSQVLTLWWMFQSSGVLSLDWHQVSKELSSRVAMTWLLESEPHTGEEACLAALDDIMAQLESGMAISPESVGACLVEISAGPSMRLDVLEGFRAGLSDAFKLALRPILSLRSDSEYGSSVRLRLVLIQLAEAKSADHAQSDTDSGVFEIPIQKPKSSLLNKKASNNEHPLYDGELMDSLTEQGCEPLVSPTGGSTKARSKGYFQTLLNLGGKKTGRFANCDPTYYDSVNLDEPTYLRKNILFN